MTAPAAESAQALTKQSSSSSVPLSSRAVTTESTRNDSRTIFGLMAFATAFSLVGNEIKSLDGQAPALGVVTEPVRIMAGGTIATVALVLVSHAGEPGRQFAVGLATIAFLSSLLVYGGPVWKTLGAVVGTSKGTTPTGATGATVPTGTPVTSKKAA